MTYTPDCIVDDKEWHEFKGWENRSKLKKHNLFQKQYPNEKFILINHKTYKEIESIYRYLVPGWESWFKNEQNITRKIDIEEREQCYKKHPFGFETYSGEFTTKNGQKLNRLSYPEKGADSLFVIDEYGFNLDNNQCLTFSYSAVITDALSSTGEYDEKVYSNELDIAAEIMNTLTTPNK